MPMSWQNRFRSRLDKEVRITVPGHTQRGGTPCPYDRVIATRVGAAAAELILKGEYGYMIAIKDGKTAKVPLEEVAGKLKYVDPKDPADQRGKNDRHQLRRPISSGKDLPEPAKRAAKARNRSVNTDVVYGTIS